MAPEHNRSDWLGVPAITWLLVIFALLVLGGGFTAMAVFASSVDAAAIAALVTAVLGVVATHIGHMAGQKQALDVLHATGQAGGAGRGGGAE